MNSDAIWGLVLFAAIFTSVALRFRRQGRARVFITDYQRGLRYVNGTFVGLVGPGSYRSNGSKNQITIVDMRPRLIVLERIFYQDALQSPSVISIGAKLSVRDAYRAATKLKDYTTDSLTIVRDAIRVTVSKSIGDSFADARRKTAAEIQKAVNAELDRVGMAVDSVEITEAWSRPVEPLMISGAN